MRDGNYPEPHRTTAVLDRCLQKVVYKFCCKKDNPDRINGRFVRIDCLIRNVRMPGRGTEFRHESFIF